MTVVLQSVCHDSVDWWLVSQINRAINDVESVFTKRAVDVSTWAWHGAGTVCCVITQATKWMSCRR